MSELNPEQRRAVEHGEGPLLVIAGPGSGKTRVITERIVYLLEKVPSVQARNILALTFTDKAAAEMKSRVRGMLALGDPADLPQVSTFHSFCYGVLREKHFERCLLDKVDLWIFLRRRLDRLGLEIFQKLAEPGAFLHDLSDFFSRCQDELVEPEDFEAFAERIERDFLGGRGGRDAAERKAEPCTGWYRAEEQEVRKMKELAAIFRASRRLLEEAASSTFGSLISETIRLWEREPEMLEPLRARFGYVLVDELQDTNYAQIELLRRVVAPPGNITAVGDDDQAIYRFRGAAHGAFEMFETAFPGAEKVYLHRNYRSTKRILRSAGVVIGKNQRYQDKPALETDHEDGSHVFLAQAGDYGSEAAWVADEIERLARVRQAPGAPGGFGGQAGTGTAYGQIAVLYRSHYHRDLLVRELGRRNVPFAVRGLSILSCVIIRDLIAYLNLIHSPHDNISLTRVLLAPQWRFPEDLSLDIRKLAAKERCSLYRAVKARERTLAQADPVFGGTGWAELEALLTGLRKLAAFVPVTAVFDGLTERLGLRFIPGDPDQVWVEAFQKFLEAWEEKSETRKLEEFLEYLAYFREAGGKVEAPEREDAAGAVQLMTVHAAKGLEFPVVFILSVARQRFPHRVERPVIDLPEELRKGPRPPADIHLQEERRLFYVAMTRARERLYISSVVKTASAGKPTAAGRPGGKRSVFVDDLLSDALVAGRDVERVEVAEKAVEESRPPLPPAAQPAVAGQLRMIASPPPSGTHPPLAEWANRPPAAPPGGKFRLSVTAIEQYRDCPLKFKFSHYLKIPTGPQAPLTFGNIMHQSVRHYFESRKRGAPTFEAIRDFYLASWKDVGFEDEYQAGVYKNAGLVQLRGFVERHNALRIPADGIELERRFELGLDDVVLEGRIDQITPLRDHSVELVDYKTGKPRTQKDADRSLQLSVYALAAERVLGMNPTRLTFYNLTNNEPVSSVRTAKALDLALEEILETAAEIRRLAFAPTPGFPCQRCDYVPLCPEHEGTV